MDTTSDEGAPEAAPAPGEPAEDIRIIGTPEARSKLWAAMGKARSEFDEVTKSLKGQTGQQTFKYTSFAMLSSAMVKPLAANGLAILQMVTTPRPDMGCVTTLLAGHGAEIWIEIKFATSDNEHGFQATIKDFGTATTYYKRYQLQAIGFIEGDRDPDETGDNLRGPARADVKAKVATTPDPLMRDIRELAAALNLSKQQGEAIMKTSIGLVKPIEFLKPEEGVKFVAALRAAADARGMS